MLEFKTGELIVFKTHPFIANNTNVKISAYSDYTSPILVVKEIKEKSFDKETGKNIGSQINCIYYNSKDGKFTEKWINSNLVNKISFSVLQHKILFDFNFKKELEELNKEFSSKNYENLIKETYLNKKVTLKSVDIELLKVKINRTKDNGQLIETNHLEFLPPLMVIIGYRFLDERNKFCEKSGSPLIELKCKWYNSSTKTFSESFFPCEVLYYIKETQGLIPDKDLLSDITDSIEENAYFSLPFNKPFELEGSNGKKVAKTIGQSESIIYKHYFYQMSYFDYILQNKSAITIDFDFNKIDENAIFGNKYPSYNNGYKLKTSDCKFRLNNYYLIIYKDTFNNITKRIIKVIDLFLYIKDFDKFKKSYKNLTSWDPEDEPSFVNFRYNENGNIFIHLDHESIPNNTLPKTIFEDDNVEMILYTNCLLRRGKYRNFKINKILEVREINNGEIIFEELIS